MRGLWLTLLVLAACKDDGQRPAAQPAVVAAPDFPPTGQLDAEHAEKAGRLTLTFMTRFAGVVDANKNDCKQMAVELKKLGEAEKDLLEQVKAVGARTTAQQKQAFSAAHSAEVARVAILMEPGFKACAADPDVDAAVGAFGLEQLATH